MAPRQPQAPCPLRQRGDVPPERGELRSGHAGSHEGVCQRDLRQAAFVEGVDRQQRQVGNPQVGVIWCGHARDTTKADDADDRDDASLDELKEVLKQVLLAPRGKVRSENREPTLGELNQRWNLVKR